MMFNEGKMHGCRAVLMLALCLASVLYMQSLDPGMVSRAHLDMQLAAQEDLLAVQGQALEILEQDRGLLESDLVMIRLHDADARGEILDLESQVDDYKGMIEHRDNLLSRQDTMVTPTYAEVRQFMRDDRTDGLEWTYGHDCTQFANAFIRNAHEAGIHACFVEINFDQGRGHAIAAVRTSDLGVMYIEPQTDTVVHMYGGMDYATYMGYSDDVSLIVTQYDSCYERVH